MRVTELAGGWHRPTHTLCSLFLDRTEQLETGQKFSLWHRSLDDGRYDGDVEVGRANVLRGRDAGDVDVWGGR